MTIDLDKIGTILRTKRVESDISLEEISNALCLRKSLIQAIESGNWELLPHEVYVKSYLKEYASFLKIYDEIFPDLVEKTLQDEPEKEAVEEAVTQPKISIRRSSFLNIPKKALVYPAIILILIGFYIADKINRDQAAIPLPKVESTAGINTKSQPLSDNNINVEDKGSVAISDGKKLMISCRERTWISVVIDDSEKKEFMLNAQEMIILSAKDRFDLLIGNAGGVKLILDGKDTEFTGKSGEVKRIKLS